MGEIRAIETVYSGYRFRSRLEARWAVFFDQLGIVYEYEPQGYVIGFGDEHRQGRPYLPDFHFPGFGSWAEVKGEADALDFQLLAEAVDWGHGLPEMSETFGEDRGLLVLGPIPYVHPGNAPLHPLLQHNKGGWLGSMYFVPGGIRCNTSGNAHFDSSWGDQDRAEWVEECKVLFSGVVHVGADPTMGGQVARAYTAARQARFEHGETPRVPR